MLAGLHDVASDLIGIDDRNAVPHQQPRDRALASADVSRQPKQPHAGSVALQERTRCPERDPLLGSRAFMRPWAAISVLLCAQAAHPSDLVGPVSCRTCHAEAYRVWAASPHARAAQTLTAEQRKQPLCLSCHSRDEARAGQAEVAGVSCETCHGGGRYYQPAEVMRDKELSRLFGLVDPSPQSCMVCHGGESPSLD